MNTPTADLTCAVVDERHLELQYVAGRLTPEEAEAFEAHYFGCDRCFALVRRATELRAAAEASPTGWVSAGRRRRASLARFLPLAAVAVLALGVLLWRAPARRQPAAAYRGGDATLTATSTLTTDSATVVWARRAHADEYRVRLFAADGTLLTERATRETTLAVARNAIPAGTRAFWEIVALDSLRATLARSALIPALPPDHGR